MAAVPQHSDAIGERDDLVDPMRGENDRHPRGGELAHDLEQDLALCRRKGRRRLVHHQDSRVERQRLRDLHQLLFADAKLRDAALWVDFDPEASEQPVGRLDDSTTVDDRPGDQRLATEEDVVGRRQFGNEIELLMDDGDARPLGVLDAGELDRRAIDPDGAVVLDVHAGEDLHQSRFAGAVLSDKRMHFARGEVEVDVLEHGDAGEGLAKAARLDDGRGGG